MLGQVYPAKHLPAQGEGEGAMPGHPVLSPWMCIHTVPAATSAGLPPLPPLVVSCRLEGPRARIVLTGALDRRTGLGFLTLLQRRCTAVHAGRNVDLDLSGLTHLDATGLYALIAARRVLGLSGIELDMPCSIAMAHHILDLTRTLPAFDDLNRPAPSPHPHREEGLN